MEDQINISSSMQDYLEAISEIEEREKSVRVTDIAIRLNIAKASVCQTINHLKDMGYINQESYGPVQLTKNGRELAIKIRQRHRKLRHFLIEVLGVDSKTAERDACLMEHAVSHQTMDKLTQFLIKKGYVKNGGIEENAIEYKVAEGEVDREMDTVNTTKLSQLKIGDIGRVKLIAAKGPIRKRILEMGITIGTEISVTGLAPFGDPMDLMLKGYHLSLRRNEASDIMVEVLSK